MLDCLVMNGSLLQPLQPEWKGVGLVSVAVWFFPWVPPCFKRGFRTGHEKSDSLFSDDSWWVGMVQRQNPELHAPMCKDGNFKGTHLRKSWLWRCSNVHLSLQLQIQNLEWESWSLLFKCAGIPAGGGDGFLSAPRSGKHCVNKTGGCVVQVPEVWALCFCS